jgi:hypothetical protein
MSMKYYVYISDTKVDMLYSQIPKKMLDKIAVELGVNLGMFSLSVKEKENREKTPLQTRIEKLRLVEKYLEANMEVGTVDQPKTYFKGSLPMRWGPLGRGSLDEVGNLIYFGGETTKTILGLGGSRHHVVGNQIGESQAIISYSWTPAILDVLTKELGLPDEHHKLERWTPEWTEDIKDRSQLALVTTATRVMNASPQYLEFLAKRLVEGTSEETKHELLDTGIHYTQSAKPIKSYHIDSRRPYHVMLGTPLYVAMID